MTDLTMRNLRFAYRALAFSDRSEKLSNGVLVFGLNRFSLFLAVPLSFLALIWANLIAKARQREQCARRLTERAIGNARLTLVMLNTCEVLAAMKNLI